MQFIPAENRYQMCGRTWPFVVLLIEEFPYTLTQDVLVMLRYEGSPVLRIWFLDVNVDKLVTWGIEVGAKCEYSALVGDVRVLGVKVVNEFDPWQ